MQHDAPNPHEHALQAGDLVLSGSYTPPLPIAVGDIVLADFGALGSVSVELAG